LSPFEASVKSQPENTYGKINIIKHIHFKQGFKKEAMTRMVILFQKALDARTRPALRD
jgi:hypothetical protein